MVWSLWYDHTGVLTKIDIMDRGTDCRDVLLGKSLKLKHGWVAVVNRGQADINSKLSMKVGCARMVAHKQTGTPAPAARAPRPALSCWACGSMNFKTP